LGSSFGDTLHYIALVVLVFQLTGRGVAVAGLVAAEVVPVLLLGPVAGVVIGPLIPNALARDTSGARNGYRDARWLCCSSRTSSAASATSSSPC
jgi:hypothetical protein